MNKCKTKENLISVQIIAKHSRESKQDDLIELGEISEENSRKNKIFLIVS